MVCRHAKSLHVTPRIRQIDRDLFTLNHFADPRPEASCTASPSASYHFIVSASKLCRIWGKNSSIPFGFRSRHSYVYQRQTRETLDTPTTIPKTISTVVSFIPTKVSPGLARDRNLGFITEISVVRVVCSTVASGYDLRLRRRSSQLAAFMDERSRSQYRRRVLRRSYRDVRSIRKSTSCSFSVSFLISSCDAADNGAADCGKLRLVCSSR